MTIIAAADGSALGNPGPAGWGWYVDPSCWASGGWPHGTNNMGELTAVLDLLQQTAEVDDDLLVLCDSKYAIDTITKWMAGWKRRGWKKGDGKPVANLEIVKALDVAMTQRRGKVRFEWVKGHAGHDLNEEADRIATAASLAYKEGRVPDAGPGFGDGRAAGADQRHDFVRTEPAAPPVEDDLFSMLDPEAEGVSEADPVVEATGGDPVQEVVALDRALHSDELREDRGAVADLLHPDWFEVGPDGGVTERDEFLADLAPAGTTDVELVRAEAVDARTVLLVRRGRVARGEVVRSAWWVRTDGRWTQRHQHVALVAG